MHMQGQKKIVRAKDLQGKAKYHLPHRFSVRADFLHSNSPVTRSVHSTEMKSHFMFIFYCLLRDLIGNLTM